MTLAIEMILNSVGNSLGVLGFTSNQQYNDWLEVYADAHYDEAGSDYPDYSEYC